MRILATGAGDRWSTTSRIPITDFTISSTYGPGFVTWKIQIWSSVARQVRLSIWGDVGNGIPVPIVPDSSVNQFTETANHWTVMTITQPNNPYPNGIGAPNSQAAYYWIFPVIHILSAAANETHYVTLMGLWPCTPGDIYGVNTPPIYDYPRDVKVVLSPQSSNLLSNTIDELLQWALDDGITAAIDPTQPSSNFSCGLTILYADPEDPASVFTVNGVGSLQVTASAPNATVWFGLVNTFGPVPARTKPYGWFTTPNYGAWGSVSGNPDAGDWFPPEVLTAPAASMVRPRRLRLLPPPVGSPWTMTTSRPQQPPPTPGNWFPSVKQPPQTGNLLPFVVPPDQPFNFSVYADYLSVLDPSNAVMDIGFRWYYPDGTFAEVINEVNLTNTLTRYSIPPPDPTQYTMANPPDEPVTGVQPATMFPFVRFPLGTASPVPAEL